MKYALRMLVTRASTRTIICKEALNMNNEEHENLTEDERIDLVTKQVLERYLPAFKALAK